MTDTPGNMNEPTDTEAFDTAADEDFGEPIPEHLRDDVLDGAQIKRLAEERIAELTAEIEEHKERALRLGAELENTRRRAEREKQDAARYGISSFARDLLSVSDNFARALELAPADPTAMDAEALNGLLNGLRMTEKELLTVFERNGVKRIFPEGEKFDPNVHQAIAQVPGGGAPRDTVVNVVAPGFLIGDRVIRAAMVTVSTGAEAAEQA
ncbi:nucleotide exchange factor GrpE [Parvularcula sp. LCG005]|uniref:nucleotide exchange factor GrpE n=1 Tax=Parvularcula sp. LCG005 TaxID=3078805 RepID=UPI0029433ABA|nr:nucleotide exchange factor GrpE [Parvularcula sp. LCG005]WOI53377.1 nucleotide exchange factor GrpE [Parvularcula sp. LCG005]